MKRKRPKNIYYPEDSDDGELDLVPGHEDSPERAGASSFPQGTIGSGPNPMPGTL